MAESGGLNVGQTRRTGWQVIWNSIDFGGFDKVGWGLKPFVQPIIIPSVSPLPLDGRIMGLAPDSKITLVLRQVTIANIAACIPGLVSNAGGIVPPPGTEDTYNNAREYTYAQLMTLHPIDMGSDTSQDFNLTKMVPRLPAIDHSMDKDSTISVDFIPYPDQSRLPEMYYGYIGSAPST